MSPSGHPTQVSPQVELASTCDYLRLPLARAYVTSILSFNNILDFLASSAQFQLVDCSFLTPVFSHRGKFLSSTMTSFRVSKEVSKYP